MAAHCNFFLSTGTGIGVIPLLFDTPLIHADHFPCLRALSWIPKSMHIPRMVENKEGKLLNIKESFKPLIIILRVYY